MFLDRSAAVAHRAGAQGGVVVADTAAGVDAAAAAVLQSSEAAEDSRLVQGGCSCSVGPSCAARPDWVRYADRIAVEAVGHSH